jgi:predicted nucleic acid-binding protein
VRIVIDTNALYEDMALDRPDARLLLAAARSGEVELVVPEIVILEAAGLFRERLGTATTATRAAQRKFASLGVRVEVDLPDAEEAAASYERTLRQKLADARARTPDPPTVGHLDLARRAVAKQKPFDGKGRGYRDTLIWLQAMEEAHGDRTVLVTANASDFAGDDPETLSPALADELEVAGLPRDRIELAETLVSVVRRFVEPSAQALTRLNALLGDSRFQEQLLLAVQDSVQYKEIDAPDDEELRRLDVQDVQVDLAEDLRDVEIDEAYETDTGTLAFNIGGTLVTEADFYPLKSEIAGADVPGVAVHDWDWNEWVVRASKSLELGFEGFGEYDPRNEEVSCDVWLTY